MNIFYASNSDFSSRQANAIQVMKMCQAFAEHGHNTTLSGLGSVSKDTNLHEGLSLRLLYWPWKRFRLRTLLWYNARQIRRAKPDLVFTRHVLLAQTALALGTPVVLELHSLPEPKTSAQNTLRQIINHPALLRIVTISQGLADDFEAEFSVDPARITVAHDGAEAKAFTPLPKQVPQRRLRAGYFGHLYPGKGMELIAALADAVPEVDFDVYGGTKADIAFWRAETESTHNVTLHGHIPHAEVASRQADCDVLLAPYARQVVHSGGGDISRWMSPLKLFEYMAAGRPIITTDLPVLQEIVTHDQTALLCPAGETDQWAHALRRLEASPELRHHLAQAGRTLLEQNYTWDMRARRVLEGLEI